MNVLKLSYTCRPKPFWLFIIVTKSLLNVAETKPRYSTVNAPITAVRMSRWSVKRTTNVNRLMAGRATARTETPMLAPKNQYDDPTPAIRKTMLTATNRIAGLSRKPPSSLRAENVVAGPSSTGLPTEAVIVTYFPAAEHLLPAPITCTPL